MKVTKEVLLKYGASKEYFDELERLGVEGSEFIQFLDSVPSKPFVHFLKRFVDLSEEEEAKYWEYMDVTDSTHIYESENISHSAMVSASEDISGCNWVCESKNIADSQYIYFSEKVQSSRNIVNCNNITHCDEVYHSFNIENSNNISQSKDCHWSNNIFQCENIDDSMFIYMSNNCDASAFLGFCEDTSNSMFSTGLKGARWMIFNEEVAPAQFLRYFDALTQRLELETTHIYKIHEAEGFDVARRYEIKFRPDVIFEGLSADFFGWISKLPGYSDEKFLSLFLTDPNI